MKWGLSLTSGSSAQTSQHAATERGTRRNQLAASWTETVVRPKWKSLDYSLDEDRATNDRQCHPLQQQGSEARSSRWLRTSVLKPDHLGLRSTS